MLRRRETDHQPEYPGRDPEEPPGPVCSYAHDPLRIMSTPRSIEPAGDAGQEMSERVLNNRR